MSGKIHHGPPGSYKTSGAIADDFLNAVLAGRHIITNVRGLSDRANVVSVIEKQLNSSFFSRFKEAKKVPESFKLTYIKTDPSDLDFPEESCAENMEMLRRFWHWAPSGVLFIIDEVQEVWPKSYRDSTLRALDYPGGIEQANADSRFLTIELAFEKHRHKNWDFIFTTPNISKVHDVVRSVSEGAYKHKNLATLGSFFKGRYIEGFHSADTNGRTSDFYAITRKKVPAYVFKLYKSTATGVFTDTVAGQSLLKNPKISGLLLFISLVWAIVIYLGPPKIISGGDDAASENTAGVSSPVAGQAPDAGSAYVASRKLAEVPSYLSFLERSERAEILGTYTVGRESGRGYRQFFKVRFNLPGGAAIDVDQDNYQRFPGLKVVFIDPCLLEFKAADYVTQAYCYPERGGGNTDDGFQFENVELSPLAVAAKSTEPTAPAVE